MQKSVTTLALALLAAAASAAAARAAESAPQQQHVEKIVIRHGGHGADAKALPDPSKIQGDHLKIDDLASLAAGESRTYTSEGGKEVVVTRLAGEGERYTLTANGHTMPLGGDPMAMAGLPGGGEEKHIVIRHEKKSGDNGEVVEDVETTGGPDVDILTAAGDGPPPLVIEIDGEKDGKVTKQVIVLRDKEEKKEQ